MNTLDGYLAFSEHSAWPVEMAGGPTPQMFGPPYTYIPFAGTPENAIQNAMCSRKALPQAAAQPTQMYVLKVSITSERLLELFKSGVVVQGSGLVAWRHYGEFKLNNVRFQWDTCSVPPVGLHQWAENTLYKCKKLKLRAFGCCSGCGGEGEVWANHWGTRSYCTSCWNAFLLDQEQADGQKMDSTSEASVGGGLVHLFRVPLCAQYRAPCGHRKGPHMGPIWAPYRAP